jgi:hypothetical protein
MKNQETIFAIKHDIATLGNLIILLDARMAIYGEDNLKAIAAYQISIKKMKKIIAKLEKEDRKTWKESLAIAHGGICSWWIENWGWVLIGGITVVSTVAFVLWRAL